MIYLSSLCGGQSRDVSLEDRVRAWCRRAADQPEDVENIGGPNQDKLRWENPSPHI